MLACNVPPGILDFVRFGWSGVAIVTLAGLILIAQSQVLRTGPMEDTKGGLIDKPKDRSQA